MFNIDLNAAFAPMNKKLNRLEDVVIADGGKAVTNGAEFLSGVAKSYIKTKSGELANSIKPDVPVWTGTGVSIEWGSWGVIYARIHEFGGYITHVVKKALAFDWEGIHWIRDNVTLKAHPYIRPASDEHGATAVKIVGDSLANSLEKEWGA